MDLDFSFTKVATQICKLCEEKGIANSRLNNFYQQKTNLQKITVEAIQE
ncbi:2928_t:CDS:1 [Funneliformis mosseae]|uniref:2928_t:CDS:1 n=1 Tax=Funneliformis mosseae TaxID=27381 RepID=A0A9N9HXT9_FUNMO|nr:2928_t:CDS:1 [Funneliformis mosseae]